MSGKEAFDNEGGAMQPVSPVPVIKIKDRGFTFVHGLYTVGGFALGLLVTLIF